MLGIRRNKGFKNMMQKEEHLIANVLDDMLDIFTNTFITRAPNLPYNNWTNRTIISTKVSQPSD
jgi:hypothetical protein